MQLVKYLIADHREIREHIVELTSHVNSFEKRQMHFIDLAHVVSMHSRAEELTVYIPSKHADNEDLIGQAYEGFQEHHLAIEMIEKIKKIKIREQWEIKVKVLCEFLSHHLDNEEEELFPKLRINFTEQELMQAAEKYYRIRHPSPNSSLIHVQPSIATPRF